MIQLLNVDYFIKNQKIISDFSYTFELGKSYGLIGSSGCGKTTLIKIMSGTIPITNGKINFTLKDNEKFYPSLTTVFQDFRLFPHLSIYQNILLPIQTNKFQIRETEIIDICTLFKVNNILSKKPYEISTGQRQRVAFIRAILLKPTILLLDEITSALDVESVQILTNYLRTLKNEKSTLIIATHSISFCKNVCDQYLFIDNGILNSSGSIKKLTDKNQLDFPERFSAFLNSY